MASLGRTFKTIWTAFVAAVGRMDKSLSPYDTIQKFRKHNWVLTDSIYLFEIFLATFWISIMQEPGFPLKLLLPTIYSILILVPFTSQFFLPGTPILLWVLSWYSNRFIPSDYRPGISVVLLPTLESVLYGANISDILTRFTHPILDIIAWIPYGVGHYSIPFVVAAFLWLFRPKEALHEWGRIFGYMNLVGVLVQIFFPCAPPWYEIIHGLTPANYGMPGSPGGLLRIDKLFGANGYNTAFTNSPLVFGAFPSLHSACACLEALFISHFFPWTTRYVWAYAGILFWSTMYMTHHYLIDVVGGSCLAVAFFYLLLPDELKGAAATAPPGGLNARRSKYEIYDIAESERSRAGRGDAYDFEDLDERESDEEMDITYRSPVPAAPGSATPLVRQGSAQPKKSHKHTASIASLIRAEERGEEGWSPIGGTFNIPPTPTPR
ncbi:inositol phosphorylceramide synthase [Phanerochaete sordida]|uniref:Inositol phosphorylceramide synthase n=1 Tax=Phanerochaete sordida TaxID=48140 RepID=A0A9P3GHY8_9APHY|nr:inositol phosphorylceramide synthase [Phanerochaete sordida]